MDAAVGLGALWKHIPKYKIGVSSILYGQFACILILAFPGKLHESMVLLGEHRTNVRQRKDKSWQLKRFYVGMEARRVQNSD